MSKVHILDADLAPLLKGKVLLYFYGQWCSPCKVASPLIDTISEEVDTYIVKIDVDQFPDIVSHYKVRSIPTMIVTVDGVAKTSKVGAITKTVIMDLINS